MFFKARKLLYSCGSTASKSANARGSPASSFQTGAANGRCRQMAPGCTLGLVVERAVSSTACAAGQTAVKGDNSMYAGMAYSTVPLTEQLSFLRPVYYSKAGAATMLKARPMLLAPKAIVCVCFCSLICVNSSHANAAYLGHELP